ncbi:MAG: F420-0:Gamma-glutamyl ligase [Cyanobacteria bacterium RYN_339]|nr:F420-0:Gamma-glutamyl ligase [Cyanobacteria bacterium RYN_339]
MSFELGYVLAGLVGAGVLGFEALYRSRDPGVARVDARQRTPWEELPRTPGGRQFTCRVPVVNDNKAYEQTIVDLWADVRVLTKDAVTPRDLTARAYVYMLGDDARTDGYFAATLFKEGETRHFDLRVDIRGPEELLNHLHAALVTVSYKTYARKDLTTMTADVVLPLSAVKPLPAPLMGEKTSIQCIPTPILTDIDDIVDVIDRFTKDVRQPGDTVTVAESVVAITQGHYFRPQDVKPGYWARRLCYFVPSKGSLSSRHGYQAAMTQVGTARMVIAFFVGFLAKLVGQNGVFYKLAGTPPTLIDDVTGTMPPFDKYIVAGPIDPERVVARIKERTGLEAAIVDANDLKRALVLAWTPGLDPAEVSRMLLDNPFGNAAEQTPIVLLRPRVAAGVGSVAHEHQSSSV